MQTLLQINCWSLLVISFLFGFAQSERQLGSEYAKKVFLAGRVVIALTWKFEIKGRLYSSTRADGNKLKKKMMVYRKQ